MLDHFRRTFDYNQWANREEVARLRALRDVPGRCVALLAHIVAAESLWISRLTAESPRLAVWPELSLDRCATEIEELGPRWRDVISGARFDQVIEYKNSKGEPWTSRVDDVLTHVVLHGAYHRGQIAITMRNAGDEPAYTDFIHCVRTGKI